MSIFHDIQQSITNDQANIAPVLLKLRLLAAKLGSKELESWVQYESKGYPSNLELPDYRKIPVSFYGSFKSKDIPFGEKANQWIRNKLPKISDTCKMTYSTILKLVEKAISNYYGLD